MARNPLKEKLVREIAEEYGAPIDEVRSIVESQFAYLKHTVEHGAFDSVRLPMFGRFWVNPFRLHKLNITRAKKKK